MRPVAVAVVVELRPIRKVEDVPVHGAAVHITEEVLQLLPEVTLRKVVAVVLILRVAVIVHPAVVILLRQVAVHVVILPVAAVHPVPLAEVVVLPAAEDKRGIN